MNVSNSLFYSDVCRYNTANTKEHLSFYMLNNNTELVNLILLKNIYTWNEILLCATKSNRQDIVEYAIQNGANNFDEILIYAARYNRQDMLIYAIQNKATVFDEALQCATRYNHQNIIDYLILVISNASNGPIIANNIFRNRDYRKMRDCYNSAIRNVIKNQKINKIDELISWEIQMRNVIQNQKINEIDELRNQKINELISWEIQMKNSVKIII